MTNKVYLSNGLSVSVVKGKWVNFDRGVLSVQDLIGLVNLSNMYWKGVRLLKNICIINIKFVKNGKTFVSKRDETLTIWVVSLGINMP